MKALTQILAALFILIPVASAAEISVMPTHGMGRIRSSVESLLERRWKRVVRQAFDVSCGSAALATILQYHFGDSVSEKDLIKIILQNVDQGQIQKRGGFSLLDLKRVAAAFNCEVRGYKLSLAQLTALGMPALVPVKIRGYNHFVVYRGVIGDSVALADPSFGNTVIHRDQFQEVWKGIAMVLERKEETTPPPAQLQVKISDLQKIDSGRAIRSMSETGSLFGGFGSQ